MDKVVLLADSKSNSWKFAEKIQKYLQKKRKHNVPLEKVSISHFGNNEINMKIPKNIRRRDVYFIIDSGGTLIEASKILRKNGAEKLFCYATHGLFTKGIKELSENFDLIMTSNTHYVEYPTVKIIDVTPLFAEAICRAQKGESISILFE